jgi:hypothetical protein
MAPAIRRRRLEVFKLHCRNKTQINYRDVFDKLSKTKLATRQFEAGDRLLALPKLAFLWKSAVVQFIAYEGPVGVNPLIFDSSSGSERFEQLTDTQVVATRTHGVIDLSAREAIIEYNHRGAKANDIAMLLEETGRKSGMGKEFSVELNPLGDQSFLEALDRFARIKLANLKVSRPNFDWTDNYQGMNKVGADSNGRIVELTVTAQRRDSLAKDKGIVAYIREMIVHTVDNIKGASVVGVREGEQAEATISLSRFIVQQNVYVRVDHNGHPITGDIQDKLIEFMEARRSETRR